MEELEMSDFEFEEINLEILNALVEIEVGKVKPGLRNSVENRITYLNNIIDKKNGAINLEDHLLLNMCYQFYRIRDKIDSL